MENDDVTDTTDIPSEVAVTIQGAVNLLEKVSREAARAASKLRKYVRVTSKRPRDPAPAAATDLLREAADLLSDRSTELHDTSRRLEPLPPPSARARHARART